MFVTKRIPRSLSAEAYRSLRTSIKYSSVDKSLKTIAITSSVIAEGKSTIAVNLAYSLSQDGARVLIIDCDLRRPSVHYKFFISNGEGLTEFLVGDFDLKSVIKKVDDSLYVITAGTIPPNPSEILGSKAMEKLLDEVAINFDYVILDTTPVLPVTDALLIAAKADATLIVVKAKKTKENMVKQAYEHLMEVRANVIGTVLNECDKSIDNKYYGYYAEKKSKRNKR